MQFPKLWLPFNQRYFHTKPLLKKELKKKLLLKKQTEKKQKEGENALQVLEVIGFDIDDEKIEKLKKGIINDEFGFEVGDLNKSKIAFTSNPTEIRKADFVIIAVPTLVTKSKEPDLSYVKSAAEIIGKKPKERGYCSSWIYGLSRGNRRNH